MLVAKIPKEQIYWRQLGRRLLNPWMKRSVRGRPARSRNYWICTSRPDGRPHSMPVWGFWTDGALYFGTERSSRKGKNLAHNYAVSVHLESHTERSIKHRSWLIRRAWCIAWGHKSRGSGRRKIIWMVRTNEGPESLPVVARVHGITPS